MALRGRAVILLYHRVASPAMDPLLLCVSPDHFTAHMDVLRKKYRPLSLAELAAHLDRGDLPARSVAVTFDDGYIDNLDTAAPILADRFVPATVFASGDCLADGRLITNELEEGILGAPILPQAVSLSWRGEKRTWDFGEWTEWPVPLRREFLAWNLESREDPTPRHRAFREIHRLLRGADFNERIALLRDLQRQISPGGKARVLMTDRQLLEISRIGGIEVGAHTRHHLVLGGLPPEAQREEILSGKDLLEQALGKPVTSFAYPYGSPWDVSIRTVDLVREAGFRLACANTPAPVDRETDPFWLPRCLVRNWTGPEFAERLDAFFQPRAETPPQG
jgi:peptidoglycan/xylan/chitin deacetylase (PgdA/CDA1 family)